MIFREGTIQFTVDNLDPVYKVQYDLRNGSVVSTYIEKSVDMSKWSLGASILMARNLWTK